MFNILFDFSVKINLVLGIKTKLKIILSDFINDSLLVSPNKIKQLMLHFKADEYGHRANLEKFDLGYGWVHYGLIRQLKPIRVLCVGSRHGYIPAILAQACKDNKKGRVDFVDAGFGEGDENHWSGVGFWKTEKGQSTFKKFGLKNYLKLFVMTTDDFKNKLRKNIEYDYIYIDGDHSFSGVKRDFNLFWPILRKGGFMAFHDVSVVGTKPEGEYGVNKLWEKVAKKNSIIFDFKGSGLGILQKN